MSTEHEISDLKDQVSRLREMLDDAKAALRSAKNEAKAYTERLQVERDHYQSMYVQLCEVQKVNQQTIEAYKAALEVRK